MHRKGSAIALMALFSLALVSAFGQTGDKAKVKGMINSRAGDTLIVKTAQGNVAVVLTENTKAKDNKGFLGVRSEKAAHEVLIPGLKVDVDGTIDNRGQVVATHITVDGDDLETSQMIQAGLTPTAKQVAADTGRIDALERRLAEVERAVAQAATLAHAAASTQAATLAHAAASTHAAAPAPDTTQAPAPAQAATPSPADAPAPDAEPVSAQSAAPKASAYLVWVGLALVVLIACYLGFVALRRVK